MGQVLAATSMPVLIAGGDPGVDGEETVDRWRSITRLPQVRGMVAGRNLLFPADGDMDRALAMVAGALDG
jgi:DhnA family fructose-bisphosphate aldolase class Ia